MTGSEAASAYPGETSADEERRGDDADGLSRPTLLLYYSGSFRWGNVAPMIF